MLLRRALGMNRSKTTPVALTNRRANQVEPIFKPLASEVEAHGTIMAVSLNDAFEESKAGRTEAARCMVNIFASEWDRLTGLVDSLHQLSLRYLPVVDLPVPVRDLNEDCFRSGTMIEFVRFNGFVDQFVFRPKLRFQLHLKLQRRAISMLSEEFHRTHSETEENLDFLPHTLPQFDLLFHDMDRLAKESLLAFKAELACLPGDAMADIKAEAEELVREGVVQPLATVSQ